MRREGRPSNGADGVVFVSFVPSAPEQPVKREEMAAMEVDGQSEYLQHGNSSDDSEQGGGQVSARPQAPGLGLLPSSSVLPGQAGAVTGGGYGGPGH